MTDTDMQLKKVLLELCNGAYSDGIQARVPDYSCDPDKVFKSIRDLFKQLEADKTAALLTRKLVDETAELGVKVLAGGYIPIAEVREMLIQIWLGPREWISADEEEIQSAHDVATAILKEHGYEVSNE